MPPKGGPSAGHNEMPSVKVEEYLEAIYKLQHTDRQVRASRLAEQLRVSPASVAERLKRLAREDYVERTSDLGISLTHKGEVAALRLVRKHRLSERFLTDILGLSWDKVHDEACRLEHVFSQEAEDKLDSLLDSPSTCPHGHPIPDKEGPYHEEDTRPLADLSPGDRAIIVKVHEEEPKMLQYLATLGLLPSVEIVIEEVAPFRGPLLVQVGRARYALGREVASKIRVNEFAG